MDEGFAEYLGITSVEPCPSEHESGMVYDPETDDAVCPLCGKHESAEMGSL